MLYIVPPAAPDEKEKTRRRIRRMDRPDGLLQCNRCGGRAAATIEAGASVHNGRRTRGTVIHKDVCAECYKRGLIVPMIVELKPIK